MSHAFIVGFAVFAASASPFLISAVLRRTETRSAQSFKSFSYSEPIIFILAASIPISAAPAFIPGGTWIFSALFMLLCFYEFVLLVYCLTFSISVYDEYLVTKIFFSQKKIYKDKLAAVELLKKNRKYPVLELSFIEGRCIKKIVVWSYLRRFNQLAELLNAVER